MSGDRVFITRRLPDAAMSVMRQAGLHLSVFEEDRPILPDELIAGVAGCAGLFSMCNDRIGADVIRDGSLRAIANMAVGFDNVDLDAARSMGIVVTNTPGVLTEATADLAMALLLAVSRRIVESDRYVREGRFVGWGPQLMVGADLYGKRIGVVGPGRIGSAFAVRAAAFGMEVVTSGRPGSSAEGHVPLDVLLETSDFVSLHCPYTKETHHLIDKAALKRMKSTAFLINTARGAVVDEAALVQALRSDEIAGAGLDVFEEEPAVHAGLFDFDNVVLAPHVGSATESTRTRMAMAAARDMVRVLSGLSPVHPAW